MSGTFASELSRLGVRVHCVLAGRLRNVRHYAAAVLGLARIVRAHQPDVVLSWAAKGHLYAAPAAALSRIDTSIAWYQMGVPRGAWMDRLATILPARAVICLSLTAANAQSAMRPRRPVLVVLPGVEIDPPSARHVSRAVLAVPEERFLIGIVGRLQPWKGQARLIRALSLLIAEARDAHLLIVGGDAHGLSPDYAAHVHALPVTLGLADRVTFTGHVPDVVPFIEMMDVMVNASDEEPFGLVVLEGMRQRKPVIAVNRGGPREIIESGITGVLVADGSPARLAAGLRELMDCVDPVAMGQAARAAVIDRFSAAVFARAAEDQLVRIASSAPLPILSAPPSRVRLTLRTRWTRVSRQVWRRIVQLLRHSVGPS
jgi:glycosyltransferase involved in cell wall biosynthesis